VESLAAHSKKLALPSEPEPRSARAIRVSLAVKATLVLGVMALAREQPSTMLLALAPLALVAAEAARHLAGFDEPHDG
jgi:hypothetical protein